MMKRIFCLAALTVGLVGMSVANAGIKYNGNLGSGLGGNIWGRDDYPGPSANYGPSGVHVGGIKVQYDPNFGAATWTGPEFLTYCITPNSSLTGAANPWELDSLLPVYTIGQIGGNAAYDRVARIVVDNWASVHAAGANLNQRAAAFNLALWSAVNDINPLLGNSAWLNDGNFGSNLLAGPNNPGTVLDYFNTYVASGSNNSLTGTIAMFRPKTFGQNQILISYDGGGGSGVVPEPFTMAFGLAAAGAFIRRKVKAKKVA